MVSFLVADDHEVTRMGIIGYIKQYFEQNYIAEAANGDEVYHHLKQRTYDMLICDVHMPFTDVYRLVELALLLQPTLKILMLSMNSEALYAAQLLKKGAKGYLEKNAGGQELVKAINSILEGNIYMSPAVATAFIQGTALTKDNPFQQLSEREMQVCTLLCEGKSLTEIGQMLNLGLSTISTNKVRILTKLGISSLAELVKLQHQYTPS